MKFIVSRVSDYVDENKPCENCKVEKIVKHIRYTIPKEEIAKRYPGENISNYFDTAFGCQKDELEEKWVIELASLDDLMQFIGEVKNEVVVQIAYHYELPEIEIYDGWRE